MDERHTRNDTDWMTLAMHEAAKGGWAVHPNPMVGAVIVKDGRALTEDGALAGSTLTLIDGVNNLVAFAGISFGEALLCATRAPADMLGVDDVGDLLPGRLADFLVLSDDEVPAIDEVWMGGVRYA